MKDFFKFIGLVILCFFYENWEKFVTFLLAVCALTALLYCGSDFVAKLLH